MNYLTEITEKSLAVYLDKREWEKRYWPNYFPLKSTPFLSYEVLIGSKGISAADIVSYNSSAPLKTRKVVDRLKGDIPPMRVKRKMDEVSLNEYNIVKATAKTDADMQALLDLVYNDIDFVVEATLQRMEWLALQALSQTTISLTTANSAGVITEEAINFGLPAANKEFVGGAAANRQWSVANAATCLPITDIQTICTEARSKGVKIRHILMNTSKFTDFRASDETKDFIYGIMITQAGITPSVVPTLKVINQVLKEGGFPDITIIDAIVDLEDGDHTITSVDPWLDAASADKYVLFVPELPLGRFLSGPIAAETIKDPGIIQKKAGHILVQSISEQDPVAQKTVGLANCFISFDKINQCWSLNSESHTAW